MTYQRTLASVVALTIWRSLGLVLSVAIAALIAGLLGANGATDAFLFARRVTSGLSAGLERSFQLLLVPRLVHTIRLHGQKLVQRSVRRQQIRIATIAVLFTGILVAGAPLLVATAAPGMHPHDQQSAILYLRIMAAAIPLAAYTAMHGAVLNALRRFSLPAIARLMPRLGVVAVLALLVPPFGFTAISVANVIGSVVMGIIVFASVSRIIRATAPDLAENTPSTESPTEAETPSQFGVRRRLLPILIGQIHMTVAAWIDLAFASTVGPGVVSILEFGQRITNLAPGVVSNSVSSVYYTEYATALSDKQPRVFVRHIARALRYTLFSAVPAGIALFLLADVLVAALLYRGSFSHQAAAQTADIIRVLAPGLAVNAFLAVVASALIADADMPQTRIIVIATTVSVSVRIFLDLMLVPVMGVVAVPIGSLVSMTILLVVVFAMASARWGGIFEREDAKVIGIISLCGALAAAAGVSVKFMLPVDLTATFLGDVMVLGIVGSTILSVYVGASYLFGLEESRWVQILFQRIFRLAHRLMIRSA
ncbi:lipid II flippase MurJ [Mesorhizobium mediterraneum]|uniref:lipid II flippase MurJ n=1 Tax=Mesorhizobium mediterraneum TaxID=43617 RepID=UPI00177C1A1A